MRRVIHAIRLEANMAVGHSCRRPIIVQYLYTCIHQQKRHIVIAICYTSHHSIDYLEESSISRTSHRL